MNAHIIAVGDEILQGQTLNTNANFLAEKLTDLAFTVEELCSIGDTKEAITKTLDKSIGKYKLILMTGGLGPTSDDITKKVLTEYFDDELIENVDVLKDVIKFITDRGQKVNKLNLQQALVPKNCKVIRNPIGTAPTMLFQKDNSILVAMPGVPFEMKQIFEEKVIPELKKIIKFPNSYIRIVHTLGIPEATLAERLSEFEKNLPQNIKIAYLPSPEGIKIKLSTFGGEQNKMLEDIDKQLKKLDKILGKNIFGYNGATLEKVLAEKLIEKNKTVAIAESCTGGLIGHKLTSVPGSSTYFKGGIISYSNKVKIESLGVKKTTIENHGAVSEQTVKEMAKGVINVFDTDYAIAVSGIAGPQGGTKEKPVGTVWIAIASKKEVKAFVFKFGNRRDINIRRTTSTAMFLLLNYIK